MAGKKFDNLRKYPTAPPAPGEAQLLIVCGHGCWNRFKVKALQTECSIFSSVQEMFIYVKKLSESSDKLLSLSVFCELLSVTNSYLLGPCCEFARCCTLTSQPEQPLSDSPNVNVLPLFLFVEILQEKKVTETFSFRALLGAEGSRRTSTLTVQLMRCSGLSSWVMVR